MLFMFSFYLLGQVMLECESLIRSEAQKSLELVTISLLVGRLQIRCALEPLVGVILKCLLLQRQTRVIIEKQNAIK